jgi:hypothetical protein
MQKWNVIKLSSVCVVTMKFTITLLKFWGSAVILHHVHMFHCAKVNTDEFIRVVIFNVLVFLSFKVLGNLISFS